MVSALLVAALVLLVLAVFWGSAEHDGRREAEAELFWAKSELNVREAQEDAREGAA